VSSPQRPARPVGDYQIRAATVISYCKFGDVVAGRHLVEGRPDSPSEHSARRCGVGNPSSKMFPLVKVGAAGFEPATARV
jgi:hypothetical protein